MASFPTAVEEVQDLMREYMEGDMLAPKRQDEAKIVQPCAARFVEGEMDPERKLSVGRGSNIGPLGAPPSLTEKLGGKLSGADNETMDALRLAVYRSLATGYLAMAEVDTRTNTQFHKERNAKDIWDFWVPTCRQMLEDAGFPKDWAEMVRGMGGDWLVKDLKELKLTRFLGGSKLNQLGLLYAQAGVHLRVAQTDDNKEDFSREVVRERREAPSRQWDFADYKGEQP